MSRSARVRRVLSRSYRLLSLAFVLDDFLDGLTFRAGRVEGDLGTTHTELNLEQSIAYIEQVFADYKRYAGIQRFHGRVAEVGPGDNCGVGLLFLADGCQQVDLVDRFYSRRDMQKHALVYRMLLDRHPELSGRLHGVDLRDESRLPSLARYYGASASVEQFFRGRGPYDFIVSRAVLEHAVDPLLGLEQMAAALAPGGMLLHKVDLRDHEMFSTGFHQLKFLEPPDWIYRLMVRNSGRPNRVLLHRYRDRMSRLPLTYSILVTNLAGVGEIIPHVPFENISAELRRKASAYVDSVRGAFCRSLRDVKTEDLSVAGFFLIARKEGAQASNALPADRYGE